jgi:hypothetical protein
METGDIKTVYRHQIFEIQPDSVSDLRPSVSEEDELMELSQSDIDFLDAEIEENPAPPSVVNVKPRIKSAPSDETLDTFTTDCGAGFSSISASRKSMSDCDSSMSSSSSLTLGLRSLTLSG